VFNSGIALAVASKTGTAGEGAESSAAPEPAHIGFPDLVGGIPLTQRLDLFGLGRDYAMYHKVPWGSFDQEDIAKGIAQFVSVKIVEALTFPVIGSIVSKIESWLLGKLSDAIFKSCDGILAIELRAMMGRDLVIMTDNGTKDVRVTTKHAGTDSSFFCGAKSDYEVTWTINPR
jgi:hypothetical protein